MMLLSPDESGSSHADTDTCRDCKHYKPVNGFMRCTDCEARRADMARHIRLINENHPMRSFYAN